MEDMFKELATLERWFNNGIVNLEKYYQIKSDIVDFYKPRVTDNTNGDLPF